MASSGGAAPSPPSGPPGLDQAIAAQERHTDELLARAGVVGTGVGLNAANRPVIRIYTERGAPSGLPADLDGVEVEAVTTGMFLAQAPTDRFPRPVPIGVSTGHPAITAGTIGARVTNGTNVYALSNNHVYARSNDASLGDGVIQPGTADGGSDPGDRIGTLADFQPIKFDGSDNVMDAAIAVSSAALLGTGTPTGGYGTPVASTTAATIGLAVQKFGRTTGHTLGTVAEINVTLNVCYQLVIFFCAKQARFVNQIAISPGSFSMGGDSGSLIVTQGDNRPVALLFAGSTARTLANPIDAVLDRFGVTIDGALPPPPGAPGAPVGVNAVAGNASVTVSWQAPASNGGSPLTGYRVYRREGAGPLQEVASLGLVTSWVDGGVTNGVTYHYRVAALNAIDEGPQSAEVSATPQAPTAPGAPTSFSVLAGDGSAHLAWRVPASDGGSPVTGYRVSRREGSGPWALVASLGLVSGFDDPGRSNGVSYTYRVTAVNAIDEGPASAEVAVVPGVFVTVDGFDRGNESPVSDGGRWGGGVIGSGETGLKVVSGQLAGGSSSTKTAWRNSSQYGPDAQVWARVQTLPGNGNAVRLYLRMQAPGSSGVDGYMLLVGQASGTDQFTVYRMTNTALTVVATFSREVAGGNRVLFRALGSTLEAWLGAGNSWTRIGNASDSTYPAAGYTGVGIRGTTGRLDDYGAGPPPSASAPGAPAGLGAVAGDGSVSLTWQAPASDGGSPLTGYRVYRREGALPAQVVASLGLVTSWVDPGVVNGTTYHYRVAAVNAIDEGPQSAEVSATPQGASPPGAPTSFSVLAGDGAAHLAWQAPASDGGSPVIGYQVYRREGPGTWEQVASLGVVSGYDDPGRSNGVSYGYRVAAINAVNEGASSAEVVAVPALFVSLDSFDRANENPLSDAGRWGGGVIGSGETGLQVISGQLAGGSSTTKTASRSSAQYGPDAQVWVRVATLPGTGNGFRLYVRLQTPGSSAADGYMLVVSQASGVDQFTVYRMTNSALTVVATFNRELAAGNRLLFRALGPTLEAWLGDGSSWTRVGNASDSTYLAAGYTGVGIRGATGRLDDYGAR